MKEERKQNVILPLISKLACILYTYYSPDDKRALLTAENRLQEYARVTKRSNRYPKSSKRQEVEIVDLADFLHCATVIQGYVTEQSTLSIIQTNLAKLRDEISLLFGNRIISTEDALNDFICHYLRLDDGRERQPVTDLIGNYLIMRYSARGKLVVAKMEVGSVRGNTALAKFTTERRGDLDVLRTVAGYIYRQHDHIFSLGRVEKHNTLRYAILEEVRRAGRMDLFGLRLSISKADEGKPFAYRIYCRRVIAGPQQATPLGEAMNEWVQKVTCVDDEREQRARLRNVISDTDEICDMLKRQSETKGGIRWEIDD